MLHALLHALLHVVKTFHYSKAVQSEGVSGT